MKFGYLIFTILWIVTAQSAQAHPVAFKGAYGVMPEYTSKRQELELNYSLSSSSAIGVSTISADYYGRDANFVIPRFNYKLYRANQPDSQTNLYVSAGTGAAHYADSDRFSALAAFQADYETRRIYTLLSGEVVRAEGGVDLDKYRYRAGFAPYLASFEGLHTWLIAQVDYNPQMDEEWSLSPVVRLFYHNYLVEVGSSTKGDIFLAGIIHF